MGVTAAVILGAGSGVRARAAVNKVYLELDGVPIIVRATRPFALHRDIDRTLVVASPSEIDTCRRVLANGGIEVSAIIPGGATRHESETLALEYLAPEIERGAIEMVLIHDGARPLFRPEHLGEFLARARSAGGAIYALPLTDDLVHVDGRSASPPPVGSSLWCAQTPQAFRADLLLEALRSAAAAGVEGTDTASSVERIGGRVAIVRGDPRNMKVTYPEDIVLAEWLLRGEKEEKDRTGRP